MSRLLDRFDHGHATAVRARKAHACDNYPRCPHGGIKAGDEYVRSIAFPNNETNQGTAPWVMRECRDCYHDRRGITL